jgi:hypothetical protein
MIRMMHIAVWGAMLATAVLCSAARGEEKGTPMKTWNFDSDKPGTLPNGFINEVGEWKVAADGTAPTKGQVMAQVAKSPKPTYNVALVADMNAKELELSVQMKPVAGEIDQGGGVVWRAKDSENYYIARYNPLEDNFRVYKVETSKRTELASADILRTPGWHELRVRMKGDHIECFLDGKKYLDVNDPTFKDAGKIGLWTKADAQTHFDDLTLNTEPK